MIPFFAGLCIILLFAYVSQRKGQPKPLSVNYHFTRQCNYSCGFCFHTRKTSHILRIEEAKNGIKLLHHAGMQKLNFAGGEPFLYPEFLGELVRYAKEELNLHSVSIVSNGSLIKEDWFKKYATYLDILAVSCDSFDESINKSIGRGKGDHIKQLKRVREWCNKYEVKFKLNTVVNSLNYKENMNKHIEELQPFRWKVFQVLLLDGENSGNGALRDARRFEISEEQFQEFLTTHSTQKCLVPENNTTMKNSYLILDEYMRFLNCQGDSKEPSQPILEVGVQVALAQSGFDSNMFHQRSGIYDWSKKKPSENSCNGCQGNLRPELEW